MVIICDRSTLTTYEIDYLKKNKVAEKWEVIEIDNIATGIEIEGNKIFRESFFITRGDKKYIFEDRTGKKWPIFTIKISNLNNWNFSELDIDAKISRVEDFFDRKFTVLLAEERTYNNYLNGNYINIPNKNLTRTWIEYESEYSINTKILHADVWSWFLGVAPEDFIKEQKGKVFKSKTIAMGRYYPSSSFYKGTDLFTEKLLKAKGGKLSSKIFYKELVEHYLSIEDAFDYIFYVPTRANKQDRFSEIVADNGLFITKEYGEIKTLHHQAKIEMMKGCFGIKEGFDVKDKKILLVDDIITDGATLTVISDLLFEEGAKDVVWLTFARTHHVLSHDFFDCDECGNYLSYRFSDKEGKWFLGCSKFPQCNHSHHNIDFPDYSYVYRE